MIYLYNKQTKQINRYDNSILLNEENMSNLESVHKDDLRNNYGKIIYDEANHRAVYEPNYISIVVDKHTNDFTRVNIKGEDDDDKYYADVLFKDYVNHTSIDVYNKVAKFYENKFYLFDVDKKMKYVPADNRWVIDIEKFKESIIEKIMNSEDEIRHHGFYHNLFGPDKTFLQPFRNVDKDNDQTTLLALRYSIDRRVRKLKVFTENTETGRRNTNPKTFYWILNGQVSDTILDSLSTLVVAYSESIKSGMAFAIGKVKSTNNLSDLEDIDKKYVQLILMSMKKAIESNPENLALLNAKIETIKKENVTLVKDENFVGGVTYNG